MLDIELVSYLLIFGLCVVFSAFTVERKSSVFSFLTTTFWLTLAIVHAGLSQASSYLSLSFLFVGLGFFFMVYGFALIISAFHTRKKAQEWEIP